MKVQLPPLVTSLAAIMLSPAQHSGFLPGHFQAPQVGVLPWGGLGQLTR